jgi:hypothetical protein
VEKYGTFLVVDRTAEWIYNTVDIYIENPSNDLTGLMEIYRNNPEHYEKVVEIPMELFLREKEH